MNKFLKRGKCVKSREMIIIRKEKDLEGKGGDKEEVEKK